MTISIANTPLSWGVHEEGNTTRSFVEVLDQIKETGYAGTELGPWGFLPTDPAVLRNELHSRELALAGGSLYANLIDPQAHDHIVEQARERGRLLAALGARFLVLMDEMKPDSKLARQAGRVRASRLTDDEWDVFATGVNHVAQALNDETGLRVAFHPHVGTHVEIPEEARNLLDRADADLVGLCLDTGHWCYAGGDPETAVDEYGDRIWHVHLADIDPNIRQFALDEQLTFYEAMQTGVFCPLGEGEVNFTAVLDDLRRIHYRGWLVVEQDNLLDEPDADRSNARSNREYLSKLGF
ncbi:MAG: xylose isomerase [Anaerolineaceae bacterium]|nr:xylose isomerase [Anaerolineaceae bacterium]